MFNRKVSIKLYSRKSYYMHSSLHTKSSYIKFRRAQPSLKRAVVCLKDNFEILLSTYYNCTILLIMAKLQSTILCAISLAQSFICAASVVLFYLVLFCSREFFVNVIYLPAVEMLLYSNIGCRNLPAVVQKLRENNYAL